jgi:iron complex outermembrane receptor protein
MIRSLLFILLLGCLAVSRGSGQDPDTARIHSVPDIIVTSTRTSEPIQQVAMGVSVVTPEQFSTGRRYELKDALWSVPGVFTQSRSGHTDLRITIRGYGARGAGNRSNAGNMRGIRLLLDGIPETEPDGRTSLDLVNLDGVSRLEVIRSNSSTLYGSASGGVINLTTNLSFDRPFVETRNSAGSFGFLRNSLNAGTLFGNSRLFVSAANTTFGDDARKGYREHSAASQFVISAGLLASLDDRTRLGVYAGATSNLFRFPGPLTRAQFDADPAQANPLFAARDERRFNRQGRLAATLDHAIDGGHELSGALFFQPKVLERSERNTYRDFNRYGLGSQARYQWSADVGPRLQSRFSAGFDHQYQDGTTLFYNLAPGGTRSDTLAQNKQEGASTLGGYVEESITIDSMVTVQVGGRYDLIAYTFRNFMVPGSSGPPQRKEFRGFTPKAGISCNYASGHMVYGTIGGGVEAPAFNEVDPPPDSLIIARGGTPDEVEGDFNPLLDPATSTSFELGARGLIPLEGAVEYLTYDVAAYLIDIRNDLVPWDGGRYYFTAAESRRTGLELGLSAGTRFGLTLQGALTLGKSRYVRYENLLGRFDDNSTAGLPTVYGSFRLRYTAPYGIYLETSLDHVGPYYADDRNDRRPDGQPDPSVDSRVPAYTLLGGTAGWNYDFDRIGVSLFATVNNLADLKYIGSAFINGERNEYFEPGMPRNVVVGLALKYW